MLFFSLLPLPFYIALFYYGLMNHFFWRTYVVLIIPAILVFLSVMRMLYAWLFQDPIPAASVAMPSAPITANRTAAALPGANQPPVVRTEVPNTSNVNQPASVIEPTTNLLGRQ